MSADCGRGLEARPGPPSRDWSLGERQRALDRAEGEGVDLLVIGGGITGAGVLRDAASRGMRALLVERDDFASGTSSRSSKFIHGGIRYIGQGQLALTREACRERDLLLRLNPNLVRPVPFLFPAYAHSAIPHWQVHTLMWIYRALANFRSSSRFQMLRPAEVAAFCPDLRRDGLRGAGLFWDAQVDDARLVLETLKSARRLGAEAVNQAELVEFLRDADGVLAGARVRDRLSRRTLSVRASAIVNATGAWVERVRRIDRWGVRSELRPAKGIHLVLPRSRVEAAGAVTLEAEDGRHLFLVPWDDVSIIGTTDAFTDDVDEPVVTIEEVHYLLNAANEAFPRAGLTTNDLLSVYAGVRPLVAGDDADAPSASLSREDRIYDDPSGLVSMAGGKLTTYRAMGKKLVDRVLSRLPVSRRERIGPSRTATLPLREDRFDASELEAEIAARFEVASHRAAYLVRTYGEDAVALLEGAPGELRAPIGASQYTLAEIPWSFRTECPVSLCDLLERRIRLALFAAGQGLPQLERIAAAAAEAAGWDEERARAEAATYARTVRRSYQIAAPRPAAARSAA